MVTPPSLPKGGGTLSGMGEALGQAGPGGTASMTLPLPVSAGRGFAPSLSLTYSSSTGNSIFGIGWACATLRISRRTSHGVPQYNDNDEFLGPDGEVLVKTISTSQTPNPTTCQQYGSTTLTQTWTVTRYQPRTEGAFHRLEHWQSEATDGDFWLLHESTGNLHMLGKTASARISDPHNAAHIAEWLVEESVNPVGDHIYYCWKAENSSNIREIDKTNQRDCSTQRYLASVQYGCQTPASDLYLWKSDKPDARWLFTLIFDYGERSLDPSTAPAFSTTTSWPARQDAFSRYEYGFEIRTHRLCHQVLMFHHFPDELKQDNALVSRLLLEYNETPVLSQLTSAQTLAYDADGSVLSCPPLELCYSQPDISGAQWQQMSSFSGLDSPPYQLVDLYGEGVPGILWLNGKDWRYRAPCRGETGTDEVVYADWVNLPQIPALQNASARLIDIDGDGQLDWVIAAPGMAGFFTQQSDKNWSRFTPFSALPEEFFHPQAQFTQLMGSGLIDLAMIGPKSVRLYANEGSAFSTGLNINQDENIELPGPGRDARELVLFADILGSGQSHLCRIRYNSVTCWPNLGGGRFGSPVQLSLPSPLDSEEQFNPENLLLADTDGSGAPDLIYVQHNQAKVWLNQGGNGFVFGSNIAFPDGVVYDRLCQLTVADIQGNGMAELVLTVPWPTPTHWHFAFCAQKPWLLTGTNNNIGANTTLFYRSSAQEWLDEKQQNPQATPALPFAMHLLVKTTTEDEVTGNQLSQSIRYRRGVYDGKEREFRGFGYVETEDTNDDALPVGDDTPVAATLLTKTWFHCGREEDETTLFGTPWRGDTEEITLNATLLTTWQAGEDQVLNTPDKATRWWMFRALKGTALRSETYGLDTSSVASSPYTTTQQRMQVRLVQGGTMPVVLPVALEQITHHYERLAGDPQVSQQVTLQADGYGYVTRQVSIAYPRRAYHALQPYPANLPDDAWENTYDDQQQKLRLVESLASFIHLENSQTWRLGLPSQQRVNQLEFDSVPAGGISYETLRADNGLLSAEQTRYLTQQNEIIYTSTPLDLRALVHYQRTAVLDETALKAYEGITIPAEYSFDKLGYVNTPALFSFTTEADLWAVEHSFTLYND
ncbi:SpvB/TcaC N-terminal domain-containing protein, partial [Salmonella enterica]